MSHQSLTDNPPQVIRSPWRTAILVLCFLFLYAPMLLLVVLWKPLNGISGIIEDFVQRRAEKGKGKGQRDGGRR